MDNTRLYTIGELAQRSGLTVKTIRFYSDSGVLPPTGRTRAGYRLYDVTALAGLDLVRTLRELGAGLTEIRQVLAGEHTLPQLARTHLDLIERQLGTLRTRRAVLRAVVQLGSTTEEALLLHRLASMTDEQRNRLLDEFWDEITTGLQLAPGFTEWLRRGKPNLPEDPSVAQVEAWVALAELVRDEDFRHVMRSLFVQTTGRATPEGAERWNSLMAEIHAAHESGESPDSARGRALVDRVVELFGTESGETDDPTLRARLAERFEHDTDQRVLDFWNHLATINNWTRPTFHVHTWKWLATALRA